MHVHLFDVVVWLVLGRGEILFEVGTSRKYIVVVLDTVDVEWEQDKKFETVLVGKEGEGVSVYVENCFLQLTVKILFNAFGSTFQRQTDAPMMLVCVAVVWCLSFLFLQVAEV